jgi:hypothetical protein
LSSEFHHRLDLSIISSGANKNLAFDVFRSL